MIYPYAHLYTCGYCGIVRVIESYNWNAETSFATKCAACDAVTAHTFLPQIRGILRVAKERVKRGQAVIPTLQDIKNVIGTPTVPDEAVLREVGYVVSARDNFIALYERENRIREEESEKYDHKLTTLLAHVKWLQQQLRDPFAQDIVYCHRMAQINIDAQNMERELNERCRQRANQAAGSDSESGSGREENTSIPPSKTDGENEV